MEYLEANLLFSRLGLNHPGTLTTKLTNTPTCPNVVLMLVFSRRINGVKDGGLCFDKLIPDEGLTRWIWWAPVDQIGYNIQSGWILGILKK